MHYLLVWGLRLHSRLQVLGGSLSEPQCGKDVAHIRAVRVRLMAWGRGCLAVAVLLNFARS